MLLMSHFNKTVMKVGYYYLQWVQQQTCTSIKNLNIVGIKDNCMLYDVIKVDVCYSPLLKILNFE